MAEKAPLRRQAKGKIAFRRVDEMLEEALKEDNFAVLLSRGKPLDLKKYFASGPEHRVALNLLKDNQVLPQSLQERKEAEQLTLCSTRLFRPRARKSGGPVRGHSTDRYPDN